jgi:L-alanine-DL-glutamate epimerase-like enolase superfamily enzyme
MRITNVSYERLDLRLGTPYTIAYETIATASNFILKLETDIGIVGFGCAAPDLVVTGETPEKVETDIKDFIIPFLKGTNPYMITELLQGLKFLIKSKSSALAMVDMALLDLASKKLDAPLYQFLGGYRHSIPTSITIGILPIDETLKIAEGYVKDGFFILKIKGGLSVEEDIEKMIRLRERLPSTQLRFDGNQGYTVAQALQFFEATKKVDIEIFEQPSKVGMDEMLGQITKETNIPVMADESIKTLKDTFRLAQNERVDMMNIKIMKVGGIMEAMHINSVAKSANMETMVGCIDECRLGISAGLHFALSRVNIKYADLDGHLDMLNDPFKNLFTLDKGILYPNDKAGLGLID